MSHANAVSLSLTMKKDKKNYVANIRKPIKESLNCLLFRNPQFPQAMGI